jgi:hypothetical protein
MISTTIDIDKYRYMGETGPRQPTEQEYPMDRNFAGWMIAGGHRFDDPTANRHAEHLAALRTAEAENPRSSEPRLFSARLNGTLRPAAVAPATPGLDLSCCAA